MPATTDRRPPLPFPTSLMASAQSVARASDALRTLRERFRETSAGTIALLEDLARQLAADPDRGRDVAALRRELHRVHGTAGSYGFAEASRLAAKLELRVAAWESDETHERTQRATIIGHFVSALRLAMSAETAVGHTPVSRRRMLLVDVALTYARGLRSEAALRGYQLASTRASDLTPASLREIAPHVLVLPVAFVAEMRELAASTERSDHRAGRGRVARSTRPRRHRRAWRRSRRATSWARSSISRTGCRSEARRRAPRSSCSTMTRPSSRSCSTCSRARVCGS